MEEGDHPVLVIFVLIVLGDRNQPNQNFKTSVKKLHLYESPYIMNSLIDM